MSVTRYRNKKYLEWVAEQDCCECGGEGGGEGGDAHHLKGIGHLSGAGLKAPDSYAIPLCRPCHTDFHGVTRSNGKLHDYMTPEDQWEHVARTLSKAIDEGIFTWNGE